MTIHPCACSHTLDDHIPAHQPYSHTESCIGNAPDTCGCVGYEAGGDSD